MQKSTMLTLQALRIAFFGTKNFAAYHLYILIHCSAHKIVIVITQENQIFSKKSLWSITKIATAFHLNILKSNNNLLQSDIINLLKKLQIDIIIVVSYGLILSKKILDIPKLGCINVHGSLLPRWRGAAPIQRAIEYGDSVTGISIISMDSGIDTGSILYTKICKIESIDNSQTLSEKLAQIGSIGLLQTINKIILGICPKIPQNSLNMMYAIKINKKEAQINWNLSAIELERRIRAFNPWPVCYFYLYQKRIRVWNAKIIEHYLGATNKSFSLIYPAGMVLKTDTSGIYVATGSGVLLLTVLQVAGKKKTSAKNILNAYQKWFIPNSFLK